MSNPERFAAPTAWISASTEFPHFLDYAYRSHFGEIWLFNNDLQMLTHEDPFRELYLHRIAGSLRKNVDAVKILVNRENEKLISPELAEKLQGNLRLLLRKGGKQRLATIYLGKVSAVPLPPDLKSLTDNDLHTWVFYTHRNTLKANPGFVMVRHNMCPFYAGEGKPRFAFVWQMRDQSPLQENLRQMFEKVFQDPAHFWRIEVPAKIGGPFTLVKLKSEWSRTTSSLIERRKIQDNDALALGDPADVVVVASQSEELDPLRELLPDVHPAPLDGQESYAILRCGTKKLRVVLSVIGEDNSAAAARTWNVIDKWKPRYVLLTGVAGGDPDDATQCLGDIVVGRHVIGYEHGKIDRGAFKQRITCVPISHDVRVACDTVAQAFMRSDVGMKLPCWGTKHVKEKAPQERDGLIHVHTCSIGSGSKLVADDKFFRTVRKDAGEAIHALEMEGDGVCFACTSHPVTNPSVGVIKSIMDFSTGKSRDGDKNVREKWKKYASAAAASFVYKLLKELCEREN